MKPSLELRLDKEYRGKTVILKYDRTHNVVEMEPILKTKEDLDKYVQEIFDLFEKVVGKKAYVIVNLSQVTFEDEESADRLGEIRRELASRYYLDSVRYGGKLSTRMMVHSQTVTYHAPANIYRTREEAIKALETIMEGAKYESKNT
ncbi:MAG: hypothetical protein L0Y56_22330 [Nitrospira sp.]|nr:hypothetical protein [Nitrospira sp.]